MAQDPKAVGCEFERTYALGRAPAVRELERCVLGCDYGGTSWTTREEADRMIGRLTLQPGVQLLDVGSGAGWPGLYRARNSGCDVTLADMPLAGLRVACERAAEDGLAPRSRVVAADGAHLPFRDGSFDAVSHSDVLCCMPAKLEMLRECRRVARTGAKMEFSVIAIPDGLSDAEHQLAIEGGPPFVETPDDYGALLARSGWQMIERADVTPTFTRAVRILLDGMTERAEALLEAYGAEDFSAKLAKRRAAVAAMDQRALKREIFLVTTGPG